VVSTAKTLRSSKLTTAAGQFSRRTQLLFLAFATYLVLPIIDVPLLGLSVSAPILFLVALDVFFGRQKVELHRYSRWIILGYTFWFGLLLSLAGNNLLGAFDFSSSDALTLVRFAYWVLAFVITVIFVSTTDLENRLAVALGLAILVLTGFRLYEAIVFGRWGAWTNPRLLTQNMYGIQFSTFSSFALLLPFLLKGRWRTLAFGAIVLMIIAIAGNGSRSSWLAAGTSSLVFFLLYAVTQRRGVRNVQTLITAGAAVIVILISIVPSSVLEPIQQRFTTFDRIEEDKSFAIRELMVQKGWRLFLDNPLFGAGIGHFRQASTPLDIPRVLQYAGQEHFNVKSAHNSYMALLGETGLAGILPYGFLMLTLILGGLRATIKLARSGEVWAVAAYAGFIGMSIHLWTLSGLTGTAPWFMYGLVAAIIQRASYSKVRV